MQKILTKLILFPVIINAAYNPFFTEIKPIPTPTVKANPITKPQIIKTVYKHKTLARTVLKLKYFGFVETKKGKFALVNFNNKTIIIKRKDYLYSGDKKFKIIKITTNNILIEDSYKRVQSVYFSSNN